MSAFGTNHIFIAQLTHRRLGACLTRTIPCRCKICAIRQLPQSVYCCDKALDKCHCFHFGKNMTKSQRCLLAGIAFAVAGFGAAEICVSDTKTFTAHMNLYGSELGDWVFEECGLDNHNPVIAMEVGETYTFLQADRTNYYHRKSYHFNIANSIIVVYITLLTNCPASTHIHNSHGFCVFARWRIGG